MTTLRKRRRADTAGFTLVEVVIAVGILALAVVMLLGRRSEAIRQAEVTRDLRTAWGLASWRMGELSLKPEMFAELGYTDSGGFDDLAAEYSGYSWRVESRTEDVAIEGAADPTQPPPKVVRARITVVRAEDETPLIELEAMFSVPEAEEAAEPMEPESGPEPGTEPGPAPEPAPGPDPEPAPEPPK